MGLNFGPIPEIRGLEYLLLLVYLLDCIGGEMKLNYLHWVEHYIQQNTVPMLAAKGRGHDQ
ncbi:hypothetical protein ACTXT7_009118, partial [Hymenolepis weldensis]